MIDIIYMEQINCIICKSDKNTVYKTLSDRFNKREIFTLVKCICGFIFLNPRPDGIEIEKYYFNPNYLPHQIDKKNIFNYLYRFIQKITFYWKRKIIESSSHQSIHNLLDIGSGDGRFLKYLQNVTDIKIFVDEPYAKHDLKSINSETFTKCQVITMWHSLEHIHDIESKFEIINKCLDSNGLLLIAVPNINAYELKYLNSDWIAYDAPRHLYHFSSTAINDLLNLNNLKVIKKMPIYQDTFFNILLSLKSWRILKSIYYIPVSLLNIFINNDVSSSILYICRKK